MALMNDMLDGTVAMTSPERRRYTAQRRERRLKLRGDDGWL
jgi:hypothetical protein